MSAEETNSNASDQQDGQSADVAGRRSSPARTTKKKKTPPLHEDQDHPQPPLTDDVEDFQCPICFQILIKPITLCCNGKHTLCTPCFEGIVEQGSMECPLCKLSIHRSWLRKHSVTGLLNVTMWDHIQRLFPDEVKKRMTQDEQGVSSSSYVPTTACRNRLTHQIAKPGEIGAEFREQAAKLEKEFHTKENEERLKQRRLVEFADDVLAHKIQYLSDSVAVDEVLHEEWDAVMEDVQKKLGDNIPATLTPNEEFEEFYATELKEKKHKEGPIIYPPEEYETNRNAPIKNGPISVQRRDELSADDIFAELDLDCDGNWQPMLEQANDPMTQSSQYSVELGGAALLAPRSTTYDNPDSLLFPNPAFVPPSMSRPSSNYFTSSSQFASPTRDHLGNNTIAPSNKENFAMSPVAHYTPPVASSFVVSHKPRSADEGVSRSVQPTEPNRISTEEALRDETDGARSSPGKISKEAVRHMLLGSPKREMGGRLLFKAKKRPRAAVIAEQPPPIHAAASPVGVKSADKTSSSNTESCPPPPRPQKNARKRKIDAVETPPKSVTAPRKTPPKSKPAKEQSVPSKSGVCSKTSGKDTKESESCSITSYSSTDTSGPPSRKRQRRTIERPSSRDPQEVLDKKMAEVLQRQFDDEKSNRSSFRVRRELGTEQYYNFRRKSLAKSFTASH